MLYVSVEDAADSSNWPDPATAASEATTNQPQQPHEAQPSAKSTTNKKNKGKKWVPLATEINYIKPKNAVQMPQSSGNGQQRRQQNNKKGYGGGSNIKQQANTATATGASSGGASSSPATKDSDNKSTAPLSSSATAGKKPNRNGDVVGDSTGERQDNSNTSKHGSSQLQQQPQRNVSGRGGSGRGRGRGGNHHQAGGRGGYRGQQHQNYPRSAGPALSHYQGKGNVQAGGSGGGLAPLPLAPPVVGDEESMKDFVRAQIEYYFSVENLCKDIFFRTQMDSDGFVPLTLISGFNRLKAVTTDIELIRNSLVGSDKVELSDSQDRVRKQGDWVTWLFPKQELVQEKQQQANDAQKSE